MSSYITAIYKGLAAEIGEPHAREVIRQLEPVFSVLDRNDAIISEQKAILKVQKQQRQARKKARKQAVKYNKNANSIYKRSMQDTGWSNGHRREPDPVYSARPYWHRPGGHPKGGDD